MLTYRLDGAWIRYISPISPGVSMKKTEMYVKLKINIQKREKGVIFNVWTVIYKD